MFGAQTIQKSFEPTSPHWDLVLFLAHQATEKYLKGFLAAKALSIPRIHDLPALMQRCLAFLPELASLESDFDEISRLYPSSRYPGMKDVQEPQALRAIEVALLVKGFAVKRFGS